MPSPSEEPQAGRVRHLTAEQGRVEGEIALIPILRRFFDLEQVPNGPGLKVVDQTNMIGFALPDTVGQGGIPGHLNDGFQIFESIQLGVVLGCEETHYLAPLQPRSIGILIGNT